MRFSDCIGTRIKQITSIKQLSMRYIHTAKDGKITLAHGNTPKITKERLIATVGVKKWEDLNLPIVMQMSLNALQLPQ
jgi:hypothetical protein